MKYSEEQKIEAKKLFLQGTNAPEIETSLGIPRRTLYNWINTEQWGSMLNEQSSLQIIHRRLHLLIGREDKDDKDLKEIDTLISAIDKLEKIEERKARARESSSAVSDDSGSGRKRRKQGNNKNDFRGIPAAAVEEKFREGLFAYQLELWHIRDERIRNILKSRQIGLTYYFAREAFADAIMTGKNKIFLSASRAQSDVFREYIKSFAFAWFEVELKGKDKVELQTDHGTATLYFLSTNSSTAQSYHGDVYVDEYFWIPKFQLLNKVASAMGSQKKWTKTYFSTPSSKTHSAYPFWSGDLFNERMKAANKPLAKFHSMKELRKQGTVCPDGQYRKVITLTDAEAHGCDLFDIEQLKLEYSEAEFLQLFMCKFIDDTGSVFKFSDLEPCLVDSSDWKDFKPKNERPYKGPVWIGYDPSRVRDGACIIVVAPPKKVMGKFRVLERIRLHNQAWQFQAAVIKDLIEKYNVDYVGIDVTGPGSGVFEQVQFFFPKATPIYYTLETKTQLVLKAQQIITDNRIEWDAAFSDIAAGFMQIKKVVTGAGHITYVADRSDSTGHADSAWALMHTFIKEGLLSPENKRRSTFASG